MSTPLETIRNYLSRPHVRPWALAGPILVLLICLPLLRPLRHPDPTEISDDELARLATIQAITERQTLAIDEIDFERTANIIQVEDQFYSNQMPTMALLVSFGYSAMRAIGLSLESHPILVPYLLTLLAVTLPVACAAGLVYRMGRMFELPRPWRTGLALAVVLGSGLVSYGVVLNAHAPAATLVLASAGCLVHVLRRKNPATSGGWLALAGFCAALAAAIDIGAAVFMILMAGVILAMNWRPSLRVGGVLLYLIGMTPPLVLHAVLTIPITGDLLPGEFHPELAVQAEAQWAGATIEPADADLIELAAFPDSQDVEEFVTRNSPTRTILRNLSRVLGALVGGHGIFSHFPVLLVGLAGVGAVMHRHWPAAAKVLASVTLAGAVALILFYATSRTDWSDAMFAARWFVVFLPLTLFWSGAWLRRKHRPLTWTTAAVALVFSAAVSLLGATNPYPREGYTDYTAAAALQELIDPTPPVRREVLAGG